MDNDMTLQQSFRDWYGDYGTIVDTDIDYDNQIAYLTLNYVSHFKHFTATLTKNGAIKKNSWRGDYND